MKISLFVILILLFLPFQGFTQEEELIQMSGIILSQDSEPLPYVHIISKTTRRGTISDRTGLFSFITVPKDTIIFSCVGYKRGLYIVPDTLKTFYFTVDIFMEMDTILLEQVEVYILPSTYEEFKEAVLNLELPEDDYERALKNISIIQTQIALSENIDPSVSFKQVMEQQYLKNITYGQYPIINNLFNPFAWAKFFDALKKGKLKIYNKKKEKKK
jgi:hypothetical protein